MAGKNKPVQYYSSAVKARSILDPDVVRHIEKCFTKKGMKEMKAGRKKRAYPKRKEIIKIPSDYYRIKEEAPEEDIAEPEYDATAEEDDEEDVDEVDEVPEVPDEYVPTESEMRSQLEEEVFGEVEFGEIIRKKKPLRSGVSDRTGRGGRNEDAKKQLPDKVVLGAVGYMLDNDNKGKEGSLNLNSLFKKRGRRKKKRTDFDAFSDEEEYTLPSNLCMKNTGVDGSRKSKRITMRRDSGENNAEAKTADTEAAVSEKEPALVEKVITEAPASAESEPDQAEAREEKLEQIREIVVTKLAPAESVPSPAPLVAQTAFTEPSSSSEDELVKKEKKLKRGRGGAAKEDSGDASQEEIEEMIRCVSRASRPSSQASDRPESQQSRPSSALPKKYARHLDGLGSPDRDSPVLAPRQRQKEARDKQLEAVKQKLYSPRAVTPVQARSPTKHDIVSENYLKQQELSLSVSSEVTKPSLGIFEQAYARKGQASKIKKLMEKQKKKAEKRQNKKYQGFGDKKEDEAEDEKIKNEKKEQKKREQVLKKAQVSRQEADLMKELLMIGVSAVEESAPSYPSPLPASGDHPQPPEVSRARSNGAEVIKNFEETQTIDNDPQQNLSEELDKLFELN